MPERRYILPPQHSGDLVVTWRKPWQTCVIRWNGRLVGMISDLRRLPQQGKVFRLPDGSTLRIEAFYTGSILFDFSLLLNDELLLHRNSSTRSLTLSSCTILFIAGVNFLTGLFYLSGQLERGPVILLLLCAGLSAVAFKGIATIFISSAIYLILGLRAWQRSWKALVIAIGLFCLDSAYLVFVLLWGGGEVAVFVHPLLLSRLVILLAIAMGLQSFEKPEKGHPTTSHLAFSETSKIKQVIASMLALLIDPISWIFNRLDQNNR